MLRRYSGNYKSKISAMYKDLWKINVRGHVSQQGGLDSAEIEHYDYSTARFRRREDVVVEYIDKAKKEIATVSDPSFIEDSWAFANSLMGRGGFNAVDRNRSITLASAIWILDQLTIQGNLEDIYPLLPDLEEIDYRLIPYVSHPMYDFDLIYATAYLLLNRNGIFSLENSIVKSALVSDDTVTGNNKGKRSEFREAFDAVVALINEDTIQKAVKNYEKKVWDFYRLSFRAVELITREESRIIKRLEKLNEERLQASGLANIKMKNNPLLRRNISTSQGMADLSIADLFDSPEIKRIDQEAKSLERRLEYIQEDTAYFHGFSLENDREKHTKRFHGILTKELSEALVSFEVEDPFESAFALFYLLDTDSDIPWMYYGSITVAYTTEDQLPFDTSLNVFSASLVLNEWRHELYTHRFQGYRWDNATDSEGNPVKRERAKNLSQMLYSGTFSLFPRVSREIQWLDSFLEDLKVENEREKEAYSLMLHALASNFDRAESLSTYLLKMEGDNEEEYDLQVDEEENTEAKWQLVQESRQQLLDEKRQLRLALHEESSHRKDLAERLQYTDTENNKLRRELADLREIVFSLENKVEADQTVEKSVRFPYTTKGKIVSFGGHPSWINKMKELLPDVVYFSPDVIPNTDVIRGADEVWIQTNCLSHAAFYRIEGSVRRSDRQMRYFMNSNAQKCAEQLVNGETT